MGPPPPARAGRPKVYAPGSSCGSTGPHEDGCLHRLFHHPALIVVITLGPIWLIRARPAPPKPEETTAPVSDPASAQEPAPHVVARGRDLGALPVHLSHFAPHTRVFFRGVVTPVTALSNDLWYISLERTFAC